MVCYPEVQKKAQAEIASVVGRDHLPDFDVRDQLPYINAIIKETMRWQPVTPLGTLSTSLFYHFRCKTHNLT
jgi:cytochrome P450